MDNSSCKSIQVEVSSSFGVACGKLIKTQINTASGAAVLRAAAKCAVAAALRKQSGALRSSHSITRLNSLDLGGDNGGGRHADSAHVQEEVGFALGCQVHAVDVKVGDFDAAKPRDAMTHRG